MKKSGIDPTSRPLPGGGGGIAAIGDSFRPNLAMGGGAYKVTLDLPHGPGGATPKLELLYSTGLGAGHLGMGWALSVPFIEARRSSPFAPADEPAFTLSGAEPLIAVDGTHYHPATGTEIQRLSFADDQWQCRTTNLVHTTFGATPASRLRGTVDGVPTTVRWYLSTVTFPNGMTVHHDYETIDGEHRLAAIRWSEFRLDFRYEPRPDPSTSYRFGFAHPLRTRCRQIELSTTLEGPRRRARTWDLTYTQAPTVGTTLLSAITLTGYHDDGAGPVATSLAPVTFDYTAFDPQNQRIEAIGAATVPPPRLGEDSSLFDYLGTSLPGVLQLTPRGGRYWENRGDGTFAAPTTLAEVPAGLQLSADSVQFADLTGSGTADLIVSDAGSGAWYEHDPASGFRPRQTLALAPGFAPTADRTQFVDLDGDGVVDLLVPNDGQPLGFFNDRGREWTGPVTLPWGDAPRDLHRDPRLRLADMNGDGIADLVLLRANGVTYWPGLGNGRFGPPTTMANTPDFAIGDPDRDVLIGDVDGDGTADLIVLGAGTISIFLNRSGAAYGPPITLGRTPTLNGDRILLADMRGSGSPGLLWSPPRGAYGNGGYWYLDLLGGTKPYLLSRINGGTGAITDITYTTSAAERSLDLGEHRRWTGHLPFIVHLVKSITNTDTITGQTSSTSYRYHDGNYDGQSRQWLGFGEVEAHNAPTAHEAGTRQRMWFHNQTAPSGVPAFVAGRGQPRRSEIIDPASGEIREISTSAWDAITVDGGDATTGPFIAVEAQRTSVRTQNGVNHHTERIDYTHNANGDITSEVRHGHWTDSDGVARHDQLRIRTTYASHPTHGLTSFVTRQLRTDGTGRVLKCFDRFYDGPPLAGLPAGRVERGYLSRQTEVALTADHINDAYGATPPAVLATLYRSENDPELGPVYVRDMVRNRHDAHGNELESLDAAGLSTAFTYGPDAITPRTIAEGTEPARSLEFDPITQQLTRLDDRNGHSQRTRYDGLGQILAVWGRDAHPDRPTETYDYDRSALPHRTTQHVRLHPDDPDPTVIRHSDLDGQGRPIQRRTQTDAGSWAVAPATITSPRGKEVIRHDAYFAPTAAYDPAPPAGVAVRHTRFDFAGRIEREDLFDGTSATAYRYDGPHTHFFDPAAAELLATDPATAPSRTSTTDAWDRVIAIAEPDAAGAAVEQRRYDAEGQLLKIVRPDGATAMQSVLDGWGNRIRVESVDAGTTTYLYDAANNLVQSTDADGRTVHRSYDERQRLLEVRHDGPTGPVQETYIYDAGTGSNLQGRLASVTGAFGTAAYSYNANGRATTITRQLTGDPAAYAVEFTYDSQHNVRSVTYPDGHVVTYGYTGDGLLRSISGVVDDIAYDAAGNRTVITYANGLETRRRYTAGDHLIDEIITEPSAGGDRFQHLDYSLDAVGRVTAIDDHSSVTGKLRNSQTFTYDRRNRLATATGRTPQGPYSFAYIYDAAGNLVKGEMLENATYGPLPDHPNRLTGHDAANPGDYVHNAAGDLIADPDLGQLSYDHRHRLVGITKPNGDTITYDYDHTDRRVATHITTAAGTASRREIEGIYLLTDGGAATKVVFDEDRRLALLPDSGDGLLHHLDRTGNVNVISNLATGAFVANHEYTPWGQLVASLVIEHRYTFHGALFDEHVDIVLLGARWYRPALGRFLTPDRYLLVNQAEIPGIIAGSNLYLYALGNPANFTDPTGRIAFVAALLIAAVVGAALGAIGAAIAGVETWDEFLLWVIGGAIGGMLAVIAWTGIIIGVAAIFGTTVSVAAAATAGLIIYSVAGFLGAILTRALDETNSEVAWFFSFLIKYAQSPIVTTVGLVATAIVAMAGRDVDFRRGMIFIEVGPGNAALTLGGVAWTQSGLFTGGRVSDDLARHEAVHSRTIAAIGELGFYVTYLTFGVSFAAAAGSRWNDIDNAGCGNPFEKTAHTENTGITPTGAHNC